MRNLKHLALVAVLLVVTSPLSLSAGEVSNPPYEPPPCDPTVQACTSANHDTGGDGSADLGLSDALISAINLAFGFIS